MAKDKKGKKKDPVKELAKQQRKAEKASKQASKAARKEQKGALAGGALAGGEQDGGGGPEEDIDALIESFNKKQSVADAPPSVEAMLTPPAPRANASMTFVGGAAGGDDVLVFFGGELFDGAVNVCNNEVSC